MLGKISQFSDELFIKLYILKSSVLGSRIKKKERGALVTGLVIGGAILASTLIGGLWMSSKVETAKEGFFADLTRGIGLFLLAVADTVFQAAATLLSYVIGPSFTDQAITKNPVYFRVWGTVRDLSNMLIVLSFVVIGIATTLRVREYEAKKLLAPLIILALLINFSSLFCGLIIDASNIAMRDLLGGGSASGSITAIREAITTYSKLEMTGNNISPSTGTSEPLSNPGEFLAKCAGLALFLLIAAYTFGVMAILLLARYAVLAVLFILSPLAFFCFVFPPTKKVWNTWWEHFIKWSFMGVISAFFISLAVSVLAAASATGTPLDFNTFCVVFIFLIVGYKMTKSGSAIGATAVLGLAATAGSYALGGVGVAARATGLKNLAKSAGEGAQNTLSSAGEKIGLVAPGTTAANRKSRLDESKKRLASIESNEELAKIAEQRPVTRQKALDKAAAAEMLAERKAFGKVSADKREAVAAHASAYGVSKDVFTKERPETFTDTSRQEAINHVRTQRAQNMVQNLGMSPETAFAGVSTYPPNDNEIRRAQSDLSQRKTTDARLGLAPVTEKDVKNKLIEDRSRSLIENARRSGRTMTTQEALKLSSDYKPTKAEMMFGREELSNDRRANAVRKLSAAKQAELSAETLDDIHVFGAIDFTNARVVEEFRKAPPKTQERIRSWAHAPSTPDPNSQFDRLNRTIAELNATGRPEDAARATRLMNNQIYIHTNFP